LIEPCVPTIGAGCTRAALWTTKQHQAKAQAHDAVRAA
jgi:hypothetical protein